MAHNLTIFNKTYDWKLHHPNFHDKLIFKLWATNRPITQFFTQIASQTPLNMLAQTQVKHTYSKQDDANTCKITT